MSNTNETVTTSRRYLVLDARRPYRIAAGILALPSIASVVVALSLDVPLGWRIAYAALCVSVGLAFGAIAVRGRVLLPLGPSTTTRTVASCDD